MPGFKKMGVAVSFIVTVSLSLRGLEDVVSEAAWYQADASAGTLLGKLTPPCVPPPSPTLPVSVSAAESPKLSI